MSQRKSEKKEMQGESLAHQNEYSLPEELHEGWCEEVVKNGTGASKGVGSALQCDLHPQKG